MAKKASSCEVRLTQLDTNSVFQCLAENFLIYLTEKIKNTKSPRNLFYSSKIENL